MTKTSNNTALVVPSIRKDSFERFIKEWKPTGLFDRVDLILMEDNPSRTFDIFSSLEDTKGNHRHLCWEDIDEKSWGWIIPRRSDTVRSFAYWYVWNAQYPFMMTMDDDCYPEPGYENLDELHRSMLTRTKWFNTLNSVRPRGTPYFNTGEREVMVNHGLWTNVLDYDAPQQLVQPTPEVFTHDNRIVPSGAYFSFCGMNAMWRRDAIPLSYHMLMGKMKDTSTSNFDNLRSLPFDRFRRHLVRHRPEEDLRPSGLGDLERHPVHPSRSGLEPVHQPAQGGERHRGERMVLGEDRCDSTHDMDLRCRLLRDDRSCCPKFWRGACQLLGLPRSSDDHMGEVVRMMGKLLLTGVMLFGFTEVLATPPDDVYDVHATAVGWSELPSCGASGRMLHDTHVLTIGWDHAVTVNGFRWNLIYRDELGRLDIAFHEMGGRLVYLTMELQVDDRGLYGRYSLEGVLDRTKDGWVSCEDVVELHGTRR
jgi:hypothetical protein